MTIKFRKKSQTEWLVLYILAMSIAVTSLQEFFRMPSAIKYTLDLAWAWLLLMMLVNRLQLPNHQAGKLAMIAGIFFSFTVVGFFLNYQSPLYYLWGMRNNARFFIFFFACILFVRERSVEEYLRFFDTLFWINFPLVLLQVFVMKKTGDYLGGIFGVQKGCNSYLNIFMLVVISRSVLRYINKLETLRMCIAKCVVALSIAVLAELKVFFVEIVVIVLLGILFVRFSYRNLLIVIGSGIVLMLALRIFSALFTVFENWFTVEGILDIISNEGGYTNKNDVNRLTAVPMIWEQFLTSWDQKLFGLGLGNCDTASFDFLNTPFYRKYKDLHYHWFSSAFMILETGIVGLTLYILFFVAVFYYTHKREKSGRGNLFYCWMAKIMAAMSIIMIFYNSALRTEAGYMMYFVLSLPFIRRENLPDRTAASQLQRHTNR